MRRAKAAEMGAAGALLRNIAAVPGCNDNSAARILKSLDDPRQHHLNTTVRLVGLPYRTAADRAQSLLHQARAVARSDPLRRADLQFDAPAWVEILGRVAVHLGDLQPSHEIAAALSRRLSEPDLL